MKTFILCGGFGTRLDYEGQLKAKPMVRIGSKPILMHLVESFCSQNYKEFVFCLGYKSETIIDYFLKENRKYTNVIQKKKNYIEIHFEKKNLIFRATLINTGINTGTGGRILLAYKKMRMNNDFMMTYGDGLSNINIKKLIKFHYDNKALVTLSAVKPKQRYGVIKINKNRVNLFDNSNKQIDVHVNGGYFVISKSMIKNIKKKYIYWENEPLSYAIKKKKLFAFKHNGFWKSLDTLKDKNDFKQMIKVKETPWKKL